MEYRLLGNSVHQKVLFFPLALQPLVVAMIFSGVGQHTGRRGDARLR